jgi:anti-sigma B factor antagonist
VLFDVGRTTIAGRPALTVRGELDLTTAPILATDIELQLDAGPTALVIDLTPTTFMDSSGARQLVRGARAAAEAGVELHIVCPRSNGPARLTIDLLNLGSLVPIVESAAEIPGGSAWREARP